MERREEVRHFLAGYAAAWPQLEIDDLLKLLYQSAFGCGHFAPEKSQVIAYLQQEIAGARADAAGPLSEAILGGFARVHIAPYAARGMKTMTLARLFMLTADQQTQDGAKAWFDDALSLLEEMAVGGELPFDAHKMRARLDAYRAAGCPSLHHSGRFRAAYAPAYRVVRAQYAQLLPVFAQIDALLEKNERVIIAIDGNSGAGKSTLAALLAAVYEEATLVHMDDFFLQMHQRTGERLAQPGGNVDYERFLGEVLAPMRRGEAFCYRPFDCARMEIGAGSAMQPGRLCIVEGSYSLHAQLEALYDLKIVLTIPASAQVRRILERNGPQMLGRFIGEWIPMENLYFEKTEILHRCDTHIAVKEKEGGAAYAVEPKEEDA